MAGFVKGSKVHYMFLKEKLIGISSILASFNLSEGERKDLFIKQAEFMSQMEEYFPNGEPE